MYKSAMELSKKVPVQNIIDRDFELQQSGSRYMRAVEHDSLVIDLETNLFYWNSIGISGNAFTWLTTIRGCSINDALTLLQEESGLPFRSNLDRLLNTPRYPYYRLLGAFYERGKYNRDYWYGRGYSDETIDHFKLGYTGKCYTIPIIHQGKLLNFQCRTPQKRIWSWSRGLGILPFNFEALKETTWILITESAVDAIMCWQYGFPAISLIPNALKWDTKYSSYLSSLDKIVLAFDNDKAGIRGTKKVAKYFKGRCLFVDWEGYPERYDVGELLKQSRPHDALLDLIDKALPPEALSTPISLSLHRRLRDGEPESDV